MGSDVRWVGADLGSDVRWDGADLGLGSDVGRIWGWGLRVGRALSPGSAVVPQPAAARRSPQDSKRFGRHIRAALLDIAALFDTELPGPQ